jgi:hypothetical protein
VHPDQPDGEQNAGGKERNLLIGVTWIHAAPDLESQPMTYKWYLTKSLFLDS